MNEPLQKWRESANAWITDQSEQGDWSRRVILDPNLETILPNLTNKHVLDLGCGEGRYSRILKSKGAIVTGIDPVTEFINHARSIDPLSTYIEAAAESLPLPDHQFDLVLSYLTIIDIPDLEAASHEINRVLKPGGELIIVTLSNMASCTDNWVKDSNGKKLYRTVDRYMEHFSMDLEWRGIKITNYHRPLSYVLGLFLNQNFVLTKFIEPLPDPQNPQYTDEFRCPNFQIYCLRKV
ncbi:MAG: class I SAM-dependent methyltransferase [Fimbriimonadaceae bacterium]